MTLDDFVIVACLILLVAFSVGYWYTSNTVYIRRKLNEWLLRIRSVRRRRMRWRA